MPPLRASPTFARFSKKDAESRSDHIAQNYNTKLSELEAELSDRMGAVLADADEKHKSILEIHGLVGEDGVARGYKNNADHERKQANNWRWIAFGSLSIAILWLAAKYRLGFAHSYTGNVNWMELIASWSTTGVLLIGAGYASRQSKMHRDNEKRMLWFALETAALGPFIADLPSDQQQEVKREVVGRLFGQDHFSAQRGPEESATLKTAIDALADTARDAVKKLSG